MGHKIDISEVVELSDDLKTTSTDIKSSLDKVEENIEQINSMESFSGKAAKEAKGYFNDLHKTILESFNGLFTDLDNNLKKHLDEFGSSVDSSDSAIIQSDYLNDTEEDVGDDYEELITEHESVNETINSVADISSATTPNFSNVTSNEYEAIKMITDLDEKLSAFTSKWDDSQTKDLLHQIEVTMNRAKTNDGEARFTDYTGSSKNSELVALKDYNEGKQKEEDKSIENLDPESQGIIEKAKEDYDNGEIEKSTLDHITSGVIGTGTAFLANAANKHVTDKVSKEVASNIVQWMQKNTTYFMDRGLAAGTVGGGVTTFSEPPTALTQTIRTGARYGVPVVGSAIDFGVQVYQGEDVTDAAVKTAGHLGAGYAGAAIGTAIGGPIGTAVGFGVGVVGSMAFDYVYDHKEEIVEGIGDAISGIVDGLGSIFG